MALEKHIEYRLRRLDKLFRSGQQFSKDELLRLIAEAPDTMGESISRRTLEYDLQRLGNRVTLCSTYVGKKKKYYYHDPRQSYFDSESATHILMVEKFLAIATRFDRLEGFGEVRDFMQKLIQKYHVETSRPVVSFDTDSNVQGISLLDSLYRAICNKEVLEIRFESYNLPDEAHYRRIVIHPHLLKEYAHRWYLIGYSDAHGINTCLATDRIRSIARCNGVPYVEPDRHSPPSTLFGDRIGISPGRIINLVIRVQPVRYKYLLSKKLHNSQRVAGRDADGWYRLQYKVADNEELRQKLLSYGNELEDMSPPYLRRKIGQRLAAAAAMYRHNKT